LIDFALTETCRLEEDEEDVENITRTNTVGVVVGGDVVLVLAEDKRNNSQITNEARLPVVRLWISIVYGSQYGAYHGIETRNGWRFSSFSLFIEQAQSDPFAAPTRVRLLIPHTRAGLPSSLYSNKTRSLGLSDYLHRSLHDYCKEIGVGVGLAGTGSWSGPKGGDLAIFPPCQHVLEQTAVRIRPSGDVVI
jgi:hypothetical protein